MKKFACLVVFVLLANVAYADYIGGLWVDPSWIKLHEVGSMKIVSGVTRQLTSAYRSNQRTDLTMVTKRWDKKPSVMTEATTDTLILDKPRKITLTGDQEGKKGWRVDNFLLIEILDSAGKVQSQKVVGRLDGGDYVMCNGKRVAQMQSNSVTFAAKQIDISPLPVKKPFKLRVTALDYGEFGEVSDIYMIIE